MSDDSSVLNRRIRCWGYYRDLATAEKAIYENWTDMFECGSYTIALIEQLSEGLCPIAFEDERWWFKTYKDINGNVQVTRCHEPVWAKGVGGYSIG
jgi:hypothetical protein